MPLNATVHSICPGFELLKIQVWHREFLPAVFLNCGTCVVFFFTVCLHVLEVSFLLLLLLVCSWVFFWRRVFWRRVWCLSHRHLLLHRSSNWMKVTRWYDGVGITCFNMTIVKIVIMICPHRKLRDQQILSLLGFEQNKACVSNKDAFVLVLCSCFCGHPFDVIVSFCSAMPNKLSSVADLTETDMEPDMLLFFEPIYEVKLLGILNMLYEVVFPHQI